MRFCTVWDGKIASGQGTSAAASPERNPEVRKDFPAHRNTSAALVKCAVSNPGQVVPLFPDAAIYEPPDKFFR